MGLVSWCRAANASALAASGDVRKEQPQAKRCMPCEQIFKRFTSRLFVGPVQARVAPTVQQIQKKTSSPSLFKTALIATGCILGTGVAMAALIKGIDAVCDFDLGEHSWCAGQTNAGDVEKATDECISTLSSRVTTNDRTFAICCSASDGGSPECREFHKDFIRQVLENYPYAKFTWSPFKKQDRERLQPITQEIKESLERLGGKEDTTANALRAEIAQKLFVDLPEYCKTAKLPELVEQMRGQVCAGQLDRLYDQVPHLLTKQAVNRLWRSLARQAHPDVGGDKEKFQQLDRAVRECLLARNKGQLSCTFPDLALNQTGSREERSAVSNRSRCSQFLKLPLSTR